MHANTDEDWESFALKDPYWAVISAEEFRNEHLTAEGLDRFFASGREQADAILETVRRHFDVPQQINLAVDFGCGVGRLLFGLAALSTQVIGLDVSPKMLELAKANAARGEIKNVAFYRNDDTLSALTGHTGSVDLITSYIVFQHVPPVRGYKLFVALLKLLKPGGVGYLHFTFAAVIQGLRHEDGNMTGSLFKYYQRTSEGLLKLVEHPAGDKQIQMNHYNLNELFCYLHESGISRSYVQLTEHSGSIGVELYFQKPY